MSSLGTLTDWACARAAANRSVSECGQCKFWTPPPLIDATSLPPPPSKPRTAWFMCLTQPRDAIAREHLAFARAAIVSARLRAPSLAPHVIYITERPHPPRPDAFTGWLAAAGVRTLFHNLSFIRRIPSRRLRRGGAVSHLNVGTYCRIDVPAIVGRLAPELRAQGIDTSAVLYTDTDVMFAGDWDYARSTPVRNFAAGTETFSPALNCGVLWLNVSAFGAEVPRLLDYAEAKGFDFLTSDQALIQQWFMAHTPDWRKKVVKSRAADPGWDTLDDASYNARPYAHPQKPSAGGEHVEPKLWHWHGYKPSDVDCWLNAIESGAWPERSWRALPNCKRGRCKWKPIVGSGCRYFGRITMKPCYLRTYVYMLAQHRKLLELADSVAGSEELELDTMRGRVRELQKELREVEG